MMPLCIGLCFFRPLMSSLIAAVLANREVAEQRKRLSRDVEEALSLMPANDQTDDVYYVALRLKATEALKDSEVCWPNGHCLGFAEPAILVLSATVAAVLAVTTFV